MGGIADYSGSLVLQLPIADATHVALQRSPSSQIRILSTGLERRSIEIDLAELSSTTDQPIEYEDARQSFALQNGIGGLRRWSVSCTDTRKAPPYNSRPRILIHSSVPEGKGVSSSAALEVAVMKAVTVAYGVEVESRELAVLCQKVENLIAGAPCGIMDQMTSACGEQNRLLELLCQPDILKGTLQIPDELDLWGIDSGVRHSVSGSDYGTVRTAAFMGYRIIANASGLRVSTIGPGKVRIDDPKWRGYLANITPAEFESKYARLLPESLRGSEFLDRYQGITDTVTAVRPNGEYPVLQATQHPVYENARVKSFASIFKNWQGKTQAYELGQLMFESHQSYSDCGLGSEATDLIASSYG
jgi:L-arabinokinase